MVDLHSLGRAAPEGCSCPRGSSSLFLTAQAVHPGLLAVAAGAGGGGLLRQDGAAVLRARRGREGWAAEGAAATERNHRRRRGASVVLGCRCLPGEMGERFRWYAGVAAGRVAGARRELLVAGGSVDGAEPRVDAGTVAWQAAGEVSGVVYSSWSQEPSAIGGALPGREARRQRFDERVREDLERRDRSRGEQA